VGLQCRHGGGEIFEVGQEYVVGQHELMMYFVKLTCGALVGPMGNLSGHTTP
jgi:hypothetical protein